MPRVSRLRKGGSAKASRTIFATGLSHATQYGSEVFGLSDLEVKTIQGMVFSCLNPVAAGRTRALTSLFGDDPTRWGLLALFCIGVGLSGLLRLPPTSVTSQETCLA
eukprot:11267661-Heterocapsa_arctica.AAC.1